MEEKSPIIAKKSYASVDDVIEFLVSAYREMLEDDGDLVAHEMFEAVNKQANVLYIDTIDEIRVDMSASEINDYLPESQQGLFEERK